MSTASEDFVVERATDVWTFRFRPLNFMMFQSQDLTDAIFALLADVESRRVKVIRADYPDGTMSPAVIDQFWHEVENCPVVRGGRREPLFALKNSVLITRRSYFRNKLRQRRTLISTTVREAVRAGLKREVRINGE